MRYLNSRIQSCYCAPIIWVFAPKNRETERVTLAMGDGRGLPPHRSPRTTESVTFRGTARRPGSSAIAIAHSRLNFMPVGTQWRCAMWRMSRIETLIFVALVVVMVAAALLLAGVLTAGSYNVNSRQTFGISRQMRSEGVLRACSLRSYGLGGRAAANVASQANPTQRNDQPKTPARDQRRSARGQPPKASQTTARHGA
jgi:hypothetical protein